MLILRDDGLWFLPYENDDVEGEVARLSVDLCLSEVGHPCGLCPEFTNTDCRKEIDCDGGYIIDPQYINILKLRLP